MMMCFSDTFVARLEKPLLTSSFYVSWRMIAMSHAVRASMKTFVKQSKVKKSGPPQSSQGSSSQETTSDHDTVILDENCTTTCDIHMSKPVAKNYEKFCNEFTEAMFGQFKRASIENKRMLHGEMMKEELLPDGMQQEYSFKALYNLWMFLQPTPCEKQIMVSKIFGRYRRMTTHVIPGDYQFKMKVMKKLVNKVRMFLYSYGDLFLPGRG